MEARIRSVAADVAAVAAVGLCMFPSSRLFGCDHSQPYVSDMYYVYTFFSLVAPFKRLLTPWLVGWLLAD
ncbi:hypothetical protein BZA05DRAFT_165752 [Tricharina praecox]|uniref:uncharacterized protein n=1 Tax=Tricharina praecox TaxID=43433 RepID=UPI00221F185B|nr:uncharacterized protein BZA05DRAFT_165752 [Tricharina praecox]KAI5857084.1 hypothetical protein BZA05DRAFT_165752 [Tricharina praecox]